MRPVNRHMLDLCCDHNHARTQKHTSEHMIWTHGATTYYGESEGVCNVQAIDDGWYFHSNGLTSCPFHARILRRLEKENGKDKAKA